LKPGLGVDSVFPDQRELLRRDSEKYVRLLWCGRLVPTKNFGLILHALLKLPSDINWDMRVVGAGKLLTFWEKKVGQLGLERNIEFLGEMDYSEVNEQYLWADVLLFPSLREGLAMVIIEAMAHGLPIIALDLHGASVILDSSCAILVQVGNKAQLVEDFSSAITKLATDPELRRKMGEAARTNVEKNYLWKRLGEEMNGYYEDIINSK
jgi:glycosyltransferase involved in cell wall biosynthesis